VVNIRTDSLEIPVKIPLSPAKKAAGEVCILDDVMKALEPIASKGQRRNKMFREGSITGKRCTASHIMGDMGGRTI
jgi:hypothetical protein